MQLLEIQGVVVFVEVNDLFLKILYAFVFKCIMFIKMAGPKFMKVWMSINYITSSQKRKVRSF